MNNQRGRGMVTSLLAIGATGAAIYGITRGIQNGAFQRLPQTVSNALKNQTAQQMTKPLENMANNQNNQQLTNTLQGGTDNLEQQMGNFNENDQI